MAACQSTASSTVPSVSLRDHKAGHETGRGWTMDGIITNGTDDHHHSGRNKVLIIGAGIRMLLPSSIAPQTCTEAFCRMYRPRPRSRTPEGARDQSRLFFIPISIKSKD